MLGRSRGNCAGILIPYLRPWDAGGRPVAYRVRRDAPDLEPSKNGGFKEKGKYLSPPGEKNHLYLPPCSGPLIADASTPIVITEGEFKTLALDRLARHQVTKPRWLAIGLSGVWNWRGTIGKEHNANGERVDLKGPIPELDKVTWKGRKVAIAFDTDVATNDLVAAARRELMKELQSRQALVGVLEWDSKIFACKGIDDLIAGAGPDVVLRHWESVQYRARAPKNDTCWRLDKNGLLYVPPDGESAPHRICGRLEICARSRDADNEGWGKLLKWQDPDQVEHSWLMPDALLTGDGAAVRERLASGGLYLAPGAQARSLLLQYLSATETDQRLVCVDRSGWHMDTFVLPRQSIGPQHDQIYLQSPHAAESLIRTAGNLKQWQASIARPAAGNSRLMLSICAGLAGPLLFLANQESGGLHYVGRTSTGKTTALVVGGSVIGGGGRNGFVQSWRNTLNGLEAIAEAHNDLTLFLDELAQVAPLEAQETAYLLANGTGKGRMTKQITVRKKMAWTLFYVSAGETTLSDHAATAGRVLKAGAEIRLLNIPADAGTGMDLFEDLHGAPNPQSFVRQLREAAATHYGTAIVAFLRYLTEHKEEVRTGLKSTRSNAAAAMGVPTGAAGEIHRAAERLALIAAAGEAATTAGVLPWEPGAATAASRACFGAWLQHRGGNVTSHDDTAAIRRVQLFLEQHGASRFQLTQNEKINNRAGFKREAEDGIEYLISPEVWRSEICAGMDHERAAAALDAAGLLGKHDPGRWSSSQRIPQLGPSGKGRVYIVREEIMER